MSPTEVVSNSVDETSSNILIRAWCGKVDLAIVWWEMWFPSVIAIQIFSSSWVINNIYKNNNFLILSSALLSIALFIYCTVAIWRCAPNVVAKHWQWVARALMVISWLRTLYGIAKSI